TAAAAGAVVGIGGLFGAAGVTAGGDEAQKARANEGGRKQMSLGKSLEHVQSPLAGEAVFHATHRNRCGDDLALGRLCKSCSIEVSQVQGADCESAADAQDLWVRALKGAKSGIQARAPA